MFDIHSKEGGGRSVRSGEGFRRSIVDEREVLVNLGRSIVGNYTIGELCTEEKARIMMMVGTELGFSTSRLTAGEKYGGGWEVPDGHAYVVVGTKEPKDCDKFWTQVENKVKEAQAK